MKKAMDKLFSKIKINKKIFVFLVVLGFISLISGSILAIILNDADKIIVNDYLNTVIKNILKNKIDYLFIFKSSIFTNLFLISLIWLLGISVIGIPIILFLYFSHIFTIGFLISRIILSYRFKGLIISFFYVFPHSLVLILVLLLLISYALILSLKLITAVVKKKQMDFKFVFNKYLLILFISILGITCASLYETFALPNIIKLIISILK